MLLMNITHKISQITPFTFHVATLDVLLYQQSRIRQTTWLPFACMLYHSIPPPKKKKEKEEKILS